MRARYKWYYSSIDILHSDVIYYSIGPATISIALAVWSTHQSSSAVNI